MRKGFVLNGQLDVESKMAPSMINLLHTYRGDINNTCLSDPQWIISTFYEEMYSSGIITEETFDKFSIPKDKTLDGVIVEKNHGVSQENWQQAKILSSPTQILKCKQLNHEKRVAQYQKQKQLYDSETKDLELNEICEKKLYQIMMKHRHIVQAEGSQSLSFHDMCKDMDISVIMENKKTILSVEAKAFIKVRSEARVSRGRISYKNLPDLKDDVLAKVVETIAVPVRGRLIPLPPIMPSMDARRMATVDIDDHTDDMEMSR